MKSILKSIILSLRDGRLDKYLALDLVQQIQKLAGSDACLKLHALLHENVSDLSGARFVSRFGGEEFFLSDHVVRGQAVLPGVAYLELARAAASVASGGQAGAARGIALRDIAWARPLVVEAGGAEVWIELAEEESGELVWEVRTGTDDEAVLHAQGRAAVVDAQETPARLDLGSLRGRAWSEQASQAHYERFAAQGLAYGPAHRSVETVYCGIGESGRPEVLARLSLAADAASAGYVLHPGVLDGAVQAIAALPEEAGGGDRLRLPFAVDAVEILGPSPSQGWAWVREARGGLGGGLQKLDIDVCDDAGVVSVRLRGLSVRVLEEERTGTTLVLRRTYLARAAEEAAEVATQSGPSSRVVVLCEAGPAQAEIAAALGCRCVVAKGSGLEIAARYEAVAVQLLGLLQELAKAPERDAVLVQVVVASEGAGRLLGGLSGLLKTAHQEHPRIHGQVIGIEAGCTAADLMGRLRADGRLWDEEIIYRGGERLVAGWLEQTEPADQGAAAPWRAGGVYLVTGGAGGLGLLVARAIARGAAGARIVLTGRSELKGEQAGVLRELEAAGAQVAYRRCDVSDAGAVAELVAWIRQSLGALHGIVHSAGVLRDSFLVKKTAAELQAVLAPKVAGVLNLDAATREEALEFVALFGSWAGGLGNVGQADYAAANAFMDGFAGWRNELVRRGERRGRTLCLDWPLWREGGMRIDPALERLAQARGMVALPTAEGLAVLEQALAGDADQVLAAHGDGERLRTLLLQSGAPAQAQKTASPETVAVEPAAINAEVLKAKTLALVTQLFAGVSKIKTSQIDVRETLDVYGIDSIMIVQLNHELQAVFGELPKTLFFEHGTLTSLSDYLTQFHADTCVQWSGLDGERAITEPPPRQRTAGPAVRRQPKLRRGVRPGSAPSGREPVAIIGLSGRYPQASNLAEYWENLRAGKDCISEIPDERWSIRGFYDPDLEQTSRGKSYSKWGGFVDGFAEFDPLFFSISPREAANMDPQERLFIMSCWQTLEDAGYSRETLSGLHGGRVGVFAGITKTGFSLYGLELRKQGDPLRPYTSFASVANRVSYLFNLHGPSMPIDTMCSASLTAIHEACENLLRDDCEMAIAGGVNLYLHQTNYVDLCQQRMLSADGRCRSFGKDGSGFVPGEGVGTILLKRLSKAIEAGDHIYGVIRGTSINHGGKTNGYTVPNPVAQAEVIGEALRRSGVDARSVSYIEAHGTGTSLGDPIEIAGLTRAFGAHTAERQFCAIGSVKSNIGHCESAAGIAGVTKVLLQMRHKTLVPSLHSEVLNPHIDFANSPFVVQRTLSEWPRPVIATAGGPRECARIAGISSFGAGGSNAHVVIEEYLAPAAAAVAVTAERPAVIVLSAKDPERLRERVAQLAQALDGFDDTQLADIAWTLQVGRDAMESRLGLIVSSLGSLRGKLGAWLNGEDAIAELHQGEVKREKDALSVFAADEDMAAAIGAWVAKGKYGKLLELWVKGLSFDWRRLYGERRPRRIPLPTYPFARERYWVPEGPSELRQQDPCTSGVQHAVFAQVEQMLRQTLTGTINIEDAANAALRILEHDYAPSAAVPAK